MNEHRRHKVKVRDLIDMWGTTPDEWGAPDLERDDVVVLHCGRHSGYLEHDDSNSTIIDVLPVDDVYESVRGVIDIALASQDVGTVIDCLERLDLWDFSITHSGPIHLRAPDGVIIGEHILYVGDQPGVEPGWVLARVVEGDGIVESDIVDNASDLLELTETYGQ